MIKYNLIALLECWDRCSNVTLANFWYRYRQRLTIFAWILKSV